MASSTARTTQSEREPLKPEEVQEWLEEQNVNTVMEITNADRDVAVAALLKHKRNVEKAVDELLQGGMKDLEELQREQDLSSIKETWRHLFPGEERGRERERREATRSPTGTARKDPIDLTIGDDDPSTSSTRFRATTRSPDPNWQLVPSTQPKSSDDDLSKAIQASWNDYAAEESDDITSDVISLREGTRPIALRADAPSKAYMALVFQSLFYVPQVRQRCSKLRLHLEEGGQPQLYPDSAIWQSILMFTILDIGEISVLVDWEMIHAWDSPSLSHGLFVGLLSKQFLEKVVNVLQTDLDMQKIETEPGMHKLFHFSYCKVHISSSGPPTTIFESDTGHAVPIEISPDAPPGGNALVTRLSQTFNHYNADQSSDHQLILQPSEMVTFEISVIPPALPTPSPEPLTYPKTLYLDEFMATNLDLANETRDMQRRCRGEIEALMERRRSLTRFEDQDTLENLRGTIDYYENIAPKGSVEYFDGVLKCNLPERAASLQNNALKLRNVLKTLEDEVRVIDQRVEELRAELEHVSNNPELQNHPYDLRAILVHTGYPGRKNIYSYVHDNGTWWHILDYTVREVTEDVVLSDPTGLHTNAGPYMLMYSRRQSESEMNQKAEWPATFINSTLENNARLREAEEVKAREKATNAMEIGA
ncbi:hypothetical protein C8F01DRAFT_781026 [Mycena amicta]|nr:hypothetical protein C8F01DRAFT_781026 [Mycena amicta]